MPKARSAQSLPAISKTQYPEPFASRVRERVKRKLGDAFGLTQYGVNLTTLAPGAHSALRHWHTHEDELVYVLAGELVLVTLAGEETVRAGDVAGWKAGDNDAHHLINRSNAPARYLEIGTRIEEDLAHYPDDDLQWTTAGGTLIPHHKDGRKY